MQRGLVALFGLLVVALLLSGTAIALAKSAWKGEMIATERALKSRAEAKRALNLTEVSGVVSSVNATKRTFTVVTSDGQSYEVRLLRIYVRSSDGALIFGGWIFMNIDVGDQVSLQLLSAKSGKVHIAFSISIDGQSYVFPRLVARG